MASEGSRKMFEGEFSDKSGEKAPLAPMGDQSNVSSARRHVGSASAFLVYLEWNGFYQIQN